MADILVETGSLVTWHDETFVIDRVNHDYSVIARKIEGGEEKRLPVSELGPSTDTQIDDLKSLVVIDGDKWAEARRRLSLIKPILERRLPKAELAKILNIAQVDKTTIYRWARKYQQTPRLSSLLPHVPNGGRQKSRLLESDEALISEIIQNFYLKDQQPTKEATIDEVIRRFKFAERKPPSRNTIKARIARIGTQKTLLRRGHRKESRSRYEAHPGQYDDAVAPLSVVQMDHTKLDILLVDERDRIEMGRPFITLAIDVYSRMIVGYYISLDPVGNIAAGQCIANLMLPKEAFLGQLGISHDWPCWGAPATLHLDNAGEFHSDMMMRACEQYSINLEYRPLQKPNYGGHIERLMGTVANEMRKLPGTTFSNPIQRGSYDSAKHAVMTLPELEVNLVRWITGVYHKRVHSALKMPPSKKWELGIFGDNERPGSGLRPRPTDPLKVHLDLLPHRTGTVQTYGVQWDNVRYYSDALRPYIGSGKKFYFKRDPRNISEIFFVNPETGRYESVPFRDSRLQAMSVWELRSIQAQLRKDGRRDIDESAIREAYEQNAVSVQRSVEETRKARLDRARRTHRKVLPAVIPPLREAEMPNVVDVRLRSSLALEAFEIEDL